MTWPAFMTLKGESQGTIDGSCDVKDLKDTIEIFAFDHVVELPRSRDMGLPTGRRVHLDITVSKEIDKSTPKLYKALCDREKLTEVIFSWYRPDGETGGRDNYYTVRLEDAVITRISPCAPHRLDPSNVTQKFMENVSFAYEKIIWTYEPDGIEHEDMWVAPEE
ncbi:MAG: hypothetical protein B6245_10625 [Desulfobacteraceae bacterium 4572_88]|nr:MAG: hypothetical protein B6245_10625 [Desulfobacteraceae bacterium 4572_88]